MARTLLLLALVAAGCTAGATTGELTAAPLTADDLREGCVRTTLGVMQRTVDLFGVATTVRDIDGIVALAAENGCVLIVDGPVGEFVLTCPATDIGDETISFTATLVFFREGLPVTDPADADRVVVTLDSLGTTQSTEARFELFVDPERGLVIDGTLLTESLDGCEIEGTLDNVTARAVADLPGLGTGVLFTSGNVDLGLTLPDRTFATGTAALVGRNALVSLEVDGVHSQGEVVLGGE